MRVDAARGEGFASRGRPYALGLFGSVALVVCLMRRNITQAFAAAIFGVSQSTVSRRWDVLRAAAHSAPVGKPVPGRSSLPPAVEPGPTRG